LCKSVCHESDLDNGKRSAAVFDHRVDTSKRLRVKQLAGETTRRSDFDGDQRVQILRTREFARYA